MRDDQTLNAEQRARFLREGHLVLRGELYPGMIADLLQSLDEEEKEQSSKKDSDPFLR